MSSPRPSLTPLDPAPGTGSTAPETDETAFVDSPSWPVTRLAGLSLLLLLGAALAGPAALAGGRGVRWLALLIPALLAAVSARVVFEAVDRGRTGGGARRHLTPALCGALVASLLMVSSMAIVGLRGSTTETAAIFAVSCTTLLAAGIVRDLEIRVRLALRRVYFVGSAEARRDLEHELARRSDASFVGSATAAGSVDVGRLVAAVRDSDATVLVIDRDAMREPALVEAASQLNLAGLHVRDLVGYYESEFKKVPLAELSPTWFLFDIAPIHRQPLSHAVRRGLEVLIAAGLLLVLSPLLAVAAIAIRVTSRGPSLYRQRRVGRGGAQFTLLKLRTMTVATEETHSWAPSQTHRVTAVGHFLRRFRLDELPQLWNVIAGDLALIGPRPEQVPIVERLEREIPYYSARHCIRPGLTGWAQVNLGYAGSVEGTVAKLQRDLYYIKHGSLRLDWLIVWLTLKTIVSGRG